MCKCYTFLCCGKLYLFIITEPYYSFLLPPTLCIKLSLSFFLSQKERSQETLGTRQNCTWQQMGVAVSSSHLNQPADSSSQLIPPVMSSQRSYLSHFFHSPHYASMHLSAQTQFEWHHYCQEFSRTQQWQLSGQWSMLSLPMSASANAVNKYKWIDTSIQSSRSAWMQLSCSSHGGVLTDMCSN